MKTIRWAEPTRSGLCDRLSDILMLSALACLHDARILMQWKEFKPKPNDVAHRCEDILIANVLKHVRLPKCVQFDDGSEDTTLTFAHSIGGACSADLFFKAHVANRFTRGEFDAALKQAVSEFGFSDDIQRFLTTLPARFVAFHIRRGDKVRSEFAMNDGTNIGAHEVDELDRNTVAAMDLYRKLGYDNFFVCGDEDDKTAPFIRHAEGTGCKVIKIPEMPKWQSTYYDIAVMTRSEHNVTSQRFSSFSLFPSMLSGAVSMTVFRLKASGVI